MPKDKNAQKKEGKENGEKKPPKWVKRSKKRGPCEEISKKDIEDFT